MLKRDLNSKDSGMIYIFSYIMMLIAQLVILGTNGLDNKVSDTLIWTILIANQAVFFFMTLVYFGFKRVNPFMTAGFTRPLNAKQILMLPVITILLLLSSAPIATLFSVLLEKLGYTLNDSMPDFTSVKAKILAIVVIGMLPAIGEEFLFRNAILRGMKKKGYLLSAILTSVLFSLMHGNVYQLIHQFFVGMALAFVMQTTGNLLAPMIIHATNNLIAVGIAFIPQTENEAAAAAGSDTALIIGAVVMILFFSVILIMALKYFMRLEKDKRLCQEVIDLEKKGFWRNYVNTAGSMLKFLTSNKRAKEYCANYNTVMEELDYYKEEEVIDESDIFAVLENRRDNLNAVKLAILGASFMVVLSFFMEIIAKRFQL